MSNVMGSKRPASSVLTQQPVQKTQKAFSEAYQRRVAAIATRNQRLDEILGKSDGKFRPIFDSKRVPYGLRNRTCHRKANVSCSKSNVDDRLVKPTTSRSSKSRFVLKVERYIGSHNMIKQKPKNQKPMEVSAGKYKPHQCLRSESGHLLVQNGLNLTEFESLGSLNKAYLHTPDTVLKPVLKMIVSNDYSTCSFKETDSPTKSFKEMLKLAYLVDVVREIGLQRRNPRISPSAFETLEKKYDNEKLWKVSERRLLFDRISFGIEEILQSCMVGGVTKMYRFRLSLEGIEQSLWRFLDSQEKKHAQRKSLDDEWFELRHEVEVICIDIVDSLIDEMATELVS